MKLRPVKPFGAVLQPGQGQTSILSLEPATLRQILDENPLVILRGFLPVSDIEYTRFARQLGDLLAWEFGEILDLKIQPAASNHIFGQGRVELHWDGAYVDQKPHYNLFQCLHGATSGAGGETLFVDTPRVLASTAADEEAFWRELTLVYSTEKKAHYGGRIESPLICKSRFDNREVIRYIEPFNEDNMEINPVNVEIRGLKPVEAERFLRQFNARLYSSDVMYRHGWHTGDFLIADNSRLLHGRSRFLTPDDRRHIKRINIL